MWFPKLKEVKKACKAFNVEVRRKTTGAIVLRGMPEDVEKSREMIAKLIKETEQQRQETVMANLVQWYYFEVNSTTSALVFTDILIIIYQDDDDDDKNEYL